MKQTKIGELVIRDLQDRIKLGKMRYGKYLTTNNGRDGMQDLIEELYDAIFYLRQVMEERKEKYDKDL